MHVLQVTWCGQVFNEPGTVLCTLISQTLAHLDPSLSSCITEFIKNEPNIVGKLIELRQVRVHLCHISFHILLVIRDIRVQSFSHALAHASPHETPNSASFFITVLWLLYCLFFCFHLDSFPRQLFLTFCQAFSAPHT